MVGSATMNRAYLVYTGGSTDTNSMYATTASLSYRGLGKLETPDMLKTGSSGYRNCYYRDAPPPWAVTEDNSEHRTSFGRPRTATLADTQPWAGPKDMVPLTSCLKRGEVKEPRFYPFKMGSAHGSHALISPPEEVQHWHLCHCRLCATPPVATALVAT